MTKRDDEQETCYDIAQVRLLERADDVIDSLGGHLRRVCAEAFRAELNLQVNRYEV